VTMAKPDRARLAELVRGDPAMDVTVDLENLRVTCANQVFEIQMKASAREAFLAATYDPLDTLLAARTKIDETAKRLGYA
jgi:3-isopropylmalate dehydratase small subunit